MRLGVVQILQAVLEAPQEHVGLGEFLERRSGKQLLLREQREHFQRRADLQRRIAAAAGKLERLRDEFDLADAPRPELDLIGELPARHFLADLRVQLAHRRERAIVEVFAVHERAHDGRKRFVFAAERARLDPGVALPLPALRDEIFLERVEARGERSRFAPGAKAHVDPENEAVRRALVERGDQAAAETREEFQIARRVVLIGIEKNEIDVGGHVQLAAAELPHAHYRELGPPAALGHLRLEIRKHRIDGDFGERGHRPAHFVETSVSRKIAGHRTQEHALAQHPQSRMQDAFVRGAALAQERLHRFARPARVPRPFQFLAQLRPRRDELLGVAGIFERVHELRYCSGARRRSAACRGKRHGWRLAMNPSSRARPK